jgi:hypothetical protein
MLAKKSSLGENLLAVAKVGRPEIQAKHYFNFKLPIVLLISRFSKFLIKYKNCENYLCNLIVILQTV